MMDESFSAANSATAIEHVPVAVGRKQLLVSYLVLTKPEITFLVTISAFAGFLIASPGSIDAFILATTLLGIALSSGGAASLNHAREWRFDASMKRTARRPIPAGIISPRSANIFGYTLCALGLGILCPIVNPLTAILAGLTIVLYVYVYTPLKRTTTLNTVVGTLPGALPALGGYTAATGRIDLAALPLFLILLFWQMPHFLSLAWLYRDDYARGGFKMLPSMEIEGISTGRQSLAFAVLTVAASLAIPFFMNVSIPFVAGTLLVGSYFIYYAFQFASERTTVTARKLFKASIWYVPVIFVLLAVERLAG